MTPSRQALIVVAVLIGLGLGLPWGGAVPTASAQTISVTSADPPSGEQGTLNLNVLIKGKGFKNGAKAKFLRAGTTDPDGINVKTTKYVSSTQLLATIDIADWATLSKFDIEVANADGRTGKGTELFSVTARKIDPCTLPDPVPMAGAYMSDVPGFPGALDSTFGNGTGKAIGPRHIDVGYTTGRSALAIQPVAREDGVTEDRIVVVGSYHDVCDNQGAAMWGIARYLPDGTPDAGFGSGGLVTLALGRDVHGVAIQRVVGTDGTARNKIVVVGGGPTVVRLDENGALDPGFGSNGVVSISLGRRTPGVLEAATVQSDGKIVAVGLGPGWYNGLVVRLNVDGSPDATFNGTGRYTYTAARTSFSAVTTQMVDGQERIVVGGEWYDATGYPHLAAWRFTALGTPDETFGSPKPDGAGRSGMFATTFVNTTHSYGNSVAVDSRSRIVLEGALDYINSPQGPPAALVRLDTAGDLDPSFGSGGAVMVPNMSGLISLAIDPSDRIVAGGYRNDGELELAVVSRYTPDGTPDLTFGTAGSVSDVFTADGRVSICSGLALQPDGRAVWAGGVITSYTVNNASVSFVYAAIMRIWP